MSASDYIIANARYQPDGTYAVVLPNGRTLKASDTWELSRMAGDYFKRPANAPAPTPMASAGTRE